MPTTLWAQELAGDEAIEPYAVLSEENTKLTFYYDEKKAERNGMDVGPFEYASERWGGHHTEITSIVFDESFANYYPNSTAYWFRSCQKLTSLENMQYLNTDSVKSMLNMFYDCGSLEELDLSHFETSKVTNLFEMFTYCGKLKTLNLSSFNTSMVSNMASMFYGCSNLTTIYVGDQWTTVAVTDGGYTFFGCDNLVGGSGTHYDSEHADYTYARIDGGPTSETPGYFTRSGDEPYTVLEPYAVLSEENTKLTFYYDDKKTERNGMSVGPFEINSERWDGHVADITTVVFADSFTDCTSITSTAYWFYKMTNLTMINGLSYMNTSNVTDMRLMFGDCENLTQIDLSNFNTANVTNMYSMFTNCKKLTYINVQGFNTANVKNMVAMFELCSGLTALEVEGFDTGNVTTMQSMFRGCSGLTSINVSNFNTSKVTDMARMFYECSGLEVLDLSGFDMTNVTATWEMFRDCSSLTTIYGGSNWIIPNNASSTDMFTGCTVLRGSKGTTYDAEHVDASYAHIDGGTPNPGYLYDMNAASSYTVHVSVVGNGSVSTNGGNVYNGDNENVIISAGDNLRMYIFPGTGSKFSTLELDGVNMNDSVVPGTNETAASYTLWKVYNEHNIVVTFANDTKEPYAVLNEDSTMLTFYYDEKKEERIGMSVGPFTSDTGRGWHSARKTITQVVFDDSFADYTGLTSTNLWFYNLSALTTITGVSNVNTENVTTFRSMFSGCSSLTALDLTGWNTSSVANMAFMFEGCSGLTSLVVPFNTFSVTAMDNMFLGCNGLTMLDLSTFNTANVKSTSYMFSSCTNLKTVYVGSEWSMDAVTQSGQMFNNCPSLVGGKGTSFSTSHMTAEYAHIDGGTDNPGYFTDKNAPVIAEAEPYAVLSEDSTVLTFYYDEYKASHNGMDVGPFDYGSLDAGRRWDDACNIIQKVVFDPSFANCTTITSTAIWFDHCSNLSVIEGIENLNVSNVTDMNSMFNGCSSLTSLDLSTFVTEKVTNMRNMFNGCSGLTSLNVSNFNTSNVIATIQMFLGCSSLETLDLSSFNTGRVSNMSEMFRGCSGLKTIYVGSEWSTSGIKSDGYGSGVFSDCTNLVGGAGTTYNYNHADYTYAHIDGGTDNPGYFTAKDAKVWSVIGTINGNWDTDTEMTSEDGVNYTASFPYMAAGKYEFKIRANGDWAENYGADGKQDGDNIVATVEEDLTGVIVMFNADTKEITYSIMPPVYSVTGSKIDEDGKTISGWLNWADDADMTKDENGIYSVTFDNMEVGNYEFKVRLNHEWTYNWGSSGDLGGANMLLTIAQAGPVTIYFDPETHLASTAYPQKMEQVATPTFSWNEDKLTISSETEGATITYKFEDGYYLVGGNGEWSSSKVQKMSQSSEEYIYTYVLQGFDTNLWFAFGDVAALNAIADDDWSQLFGATVDGSDLSGKYDRRYNLGADKSFNVDGSAPYYRFTINTQDKTYLIEPLDSDPGFIASSDVVYTYTDPVEIKSDVFISAVAKKEGMKDSETTTLDYPYTAWRDLRDAEDKGQSVIAEYAGNDKVPEKLLDELKYLMDEAHQMYVQRTAERASIEDMTAKIQSMIQDVMAMAAAEAEPYAVLSEENTVLTFYYDEKKAERNGMSVGPFAQDQSEARGWNDNSETIVSAIIDDSFANYTELTSLAHWFSNCKNLETITGMNNLKTEKVTSMYYMFSGCEKLRSVDVSGLNTSNVRNMWGVFWYCSSLTELDLSNFDTSNAYTIGGMFESCSSLTSLDVSGFNIEKVSSIYEIFDGCKSLTDIKLFEFKNNDVDDLFAMFRNCSSLTTLDLTSFNTSNVKEMPAMFSGCTNLKTIYVGSEWSTAAVTNGESMFNNCTSLVGGAGTVYDENHIDYTYAHIDGGTSNPGYFTDKNAPVINVTLNEYGVLSVNSDVTMAEALEEASKKHNVEKWITAIVWNSNKPIANSELQSLTNPNMLIFVPADSLAPQNRDNVVIGDLAKNIVLKDVTEGNGSFYSPKSFKAEMISYTHEYRQQTEIGVARGWETIALPFTVQTIMHEKQGRIVPFGISDSGANFWLRQMTSSGLQRATQIEANVPYIISMPNNEAYYAQNNLAGRVTFSSQDAMVPMTEYTAVHMQVEGGMLMFVPCFQTTQTGNMIYALNVGEARGNHPEGSVFEANYRDIRPFEAYTVHEGNYGPAPQYIPVFDLNEAGFTGIEEVRCQMSDGRSDVWYDLNGRRLQSEPTQKGVYLHNGRKQVVK